MLRLIKVIMFFVFQFSFLGPYALMLTVDLLLAVPHNQDDLALDDGDFLEQAMKLFGQSKSLLLANVSAIGTGTVCNKPPFPYTPDIDYLLVHFFY